ncbi:hypothetical protein PR048_011458 [Dryococelus australis]|uniref:Uncharacterized protein n=1 Tax=Dryococelus australis TaxID=614101 RepID=A0ABQ9HME0_9NEOP|nr:hypothetical protein PR048_011458 [Dryococelus australis]
MYVTTTYEKEGKMKTMCRPVKKEMKVLIKILVQLEETMPSFLQHAAMIVHQYQTITELKNNLTEESNKEIQAVHFGGARQQITLHTGVLHLRRKGNVSAQDFCSLSNNSRHDIMVVWAHLKPICKWLKNQS